MESSKKNRCDGIVFQQDQNEFSPLNIGGSFSLACGSDQLKIFESNEPTEMSVTFRLSENGIADDGCDLKVKVEIEDGKDLEFFIPGPSISPVRTEQNSIGFYSKNVKKIIIQCLGGGTSGGCLGDYQIFIPLRERGRKKNLCPITLIQGSGGNFDLTCGTDLKIFQSDEPAELAFSVRLSSNTQEISCELKVKVEIEDGKDLEFFIPRPFLQNGQNTISFYSNKIRSVKVICESDGGVACRGSFTQFLVLRGEEEDCCKD